MLVEKASTEAQFIFRHISRPHTLSLCYLSIVWWQKPGEGGSNTTSCELNSKVLALLRTCPLRKKHKSTKTGNILGRAILALKHGRRHAVGHEPPPILFDITRFVSTNH